jgi:hypothetical protein
MRPQAVAAQPRSGLNLDADVEAGIAGTRARNETELLGMAAPTLDNNPRLIDPTRTLTPDQRIAQEASARQLAEAVQRIPEPPADLQTLEEVVVVGSRSGTGPSMRQIDQSFMSSAWDSWRHSWGSKLRDLKHAVNGPGPLIDPRSVIDAGKGALSYVADNLMMAVPGSSYFEFGQEAEQRLRDRYSSLGDRVERAANESWDKINLFAETWRGGDTASAGWLWGETVSDVQAWTAEQGAYFAAGGALGKLGRMGPLAKVVDDLGVPASRSTNPLSPVLEFDAYGNENFYRTMSPGDFAKLQRTGKIPATGETFISPSEVYSSGYEGVLVRVTTKPGTMQQLMGMGVTANPGTANLFPALPSATKGGRQVVRCSSSKEMW